MVLPYPAPTLQLRVGTRGAFASRLHREVKCVRDHARQNTPRPRVRLGEPARAPWNQRQFLVSAHCTFLVGTATSSVDSEATENERGEGPTRSPEEPPRRACGEKHAKPRWIGRALWWPLHNEIRGFS